MLKHLSEIKHAHTLMSQTITQITHTHTHTHTQAGAHPCKAAGGGRSDRQLTQAGQKSEGLPG